MKPLRKFFIRTLTLLASITAGVLLARSHATVRFGPSAEMLAAFSEMDPFRRIANGLRSIERQSSDGCADLARLLERRDIAARFCAPELFRATLFRWGQCDPQRALLFLGHTRQTDQLALSQAAILFGWLDADAAAALAWCRANPWPAFDLSGHRLSWAEHSSRAMAERDLDGALRQLDDRDVFTTFEGVAPFLRVTRPPHETPWLEPGPSSERYNHRWIGLVLAWAQDEPLAAYRWLVNAKNTPVGTDAVIQMLLSRWFREEPARVADLVVYENRNNGWLDGFHQSLTLWARRDPAGFLKWVRMLPARIADDQFKARRAIAAAEVNPDLALDLALEIKDADLRSEIIEDCVGLCRHRFPSAYSGWLERRGAQIPPDARKPVVR